MRKLQVLIFANLALLSAACGGKTASDTATTSGPGTSESSSTGGRSYMPVPAAGGNISSGASNGNSNGGNISQSQGGHATGGIMSVGGVATTGGYVGIGGAGVAGTSSVPVAPCGLSDTDTCAAVGANCGSIVDGCEVTHACGNCPTGGTCGLITANVCDFNPCLTACDASRNCGYQSDNCCGLLTCGPNANGACSDSTMPCVAGTCTSDGYSPPGVPLTCVAGYQGCTCDSMGGCAPGLGLTCTAITAEPGLSLCCNSTGNCAPPAGATEIAATCSATTTGPSCTPGVTIPAATSTTDNCGYPVGSLNKDMTLCGIAATGGGPVTAVIQAFYNAEHALTLGCATAAYPVSALPADPGAVYYPQTGDPACVDSVGRAMRPSMYFTDVTYDPTCTAGDEQSGGKPYDPIAVFGTWTYATESDAGTPVNPASLAMNYWNLGAGSDLIPASVSAQCPCTSDSCVTTGNTAMGYGAEVRFEMGFISGHSYRVQVMVHGGDPTQGSNAGEACVIFCGGTEACFPMTCADYPAGTYGPQVRWLRRLY